MSAVLFVSKYPDDFRQAIGALMTIYGPLDRPIEQALSAEEIASIRVIVTMGTVKVDAALIEKLPNLGLICNYGSGFEGTDRIAATKRGILVTHSPGGNAAAVADMGIGLLLATCRKIVAADHMVRAGQWAGAATSAARMPLVRGMTGRKVGIFGLGLIGEKMALRAASFEMEVAYYNRTKRDDVPYAYHSSLESLVEWADTLIIAARADATNRHVVGRSILRALGPDGIVVNIGRGSLVDEQALIELLRAGELGGAGLDVFETEPNVPVALRELDQVVLTPHIAGGAFDAHENLKTMVLANVTAFLDGRPVPNALPPAYPRSET